jgi:hypothetical protein
MASSSSFRPPVKTTTGVKTRVSSGFEATPMDVDFLDAYDVSASDEETPNERAEGKTVDETNVSTTTARDGAMGTKREREVETTASRDDAPRNAEATAARATTTPTPRRRRRRRRRCVRFVRWEVDRCARNRR